MKRYYKCECGNDTFIRTYNVWNEKIKVEIIEKNGEELIDIEELGHVKDHLYGYICEKCNKDAEELNDWL